MVPVLSGVFFFWSLERQVVALMVSQSSTCVSTRFVCLMLILHDPIMREKMSAQHNGCQFHLWELQDQDVILI